MSDSKQQQTLDCMVEGLTKLLRIVSIAKAQSAVMEVSHHSNALYFDYIAEQVKHLLLAADKENKPKRYTFCLSAPFELAAFYTQVVSTHKSGHERHCEGPQFVWQISAPSMDDSSFTLKYRIAPGLNIQELKDVDWDMISLTVARLGKPNGVTLLDQLRTHLVAYRQLIDLLHLKLGLVFEMALLVGHFFGFQTFHQTETLYHTYGYHGN